MCFPNSQLLIFVRSELELIRSCLLCCSQNVGSFVSSSGDGDCFSTYIIEVVETCYLNSKSTSPSSPSSGWAAEEEGVAATAAHASSRFSRDVHVDNLEILFFFLIGLLEAEMPGIRGSFSDYADPISWSSLTSASGSCSAFSSKAGGEDCCSSIGGAGMGCGYYIWGCWGTVLAVAVH